MGTELLFNEKVLGIDSAAKGHNTVNVINNTELYTYKGLK